MKSRLFIALVIVCAMLSITPSVPATAANTATVSLDTAVSSCSHGRLLITVNLDVSRSREFGVAATSGGTVLNQFEQSSGPGTTYTGGYNFPFSVAQPAGTLIGLYGYMGQTPPSASNTAEFFLAYNCSTLAVVRSCAGAYGSCPRDWPGIPGQTFSGPPLPAGFVLRTIHCNVAVYDQPGGVPVGENRIVAGQTWYVNPTPVKAPDGASWTEIFVGGFTNGFIPTSCVG